MVSERPDPAGSGSTVLDEGIPGRDDNGHPLVVASSKPTVSGAGYVWRRLRHSPTFWVGISIVAFWVLMALFAPLLSPYGADATDPLHALAPPSSAHWLGTDELGRDVLSRMFAGAASVLTMAPLATALGLVLGTLMGLAAGYYRGPLDELLMRSVDVLLAIPGLIIAVIVLGLVGPSEVTVIFLIGFFFSPLIARTVRSAAISEREREYVRAARMRGERGPHIMFVEILPNVTGPILVEGTVRLGYAIFYVATLSFLGLGLQPPSPDWGLSVANDRVYIQSAPWTVLAPAVAIGSLVVSVNLVADGLRRAFQD